MACTSFQSVSGSAGAVQGSPVFCAASCPPLLASLSAAMRMSMSGHCKVRASTTVWMLFLSSANMTGSCLSSAMCTDTHVAQPSANQTVPGFSGLNRPTTPNTPPSLFSPVLNRLSPLGWIRCWPTCWRSVL